MNKNFKTLLLIGGGIYVVHLIRTAYALLNFNIRLVDGWIHKINFTEMELRFKIAVTNMTSQTIDLSFIDAEISIDNKYVGRCFEPINKRLNKKFETQNITFAIKVSLGSILSVILDAISSGNLKNHTIGVKGSMNANNIGFPFDAKVNLADM